MLHGNMFFAMQFPLLIVNMYNWKLMTIQNTVLYFESKKNLNEKVTTRLLVLSNPKLDYIRRVCLFLTHCFCVL